MFEEKLEKFAVKCVTSLDSITFQVLQDIYIKEPCVNSFEDAFKKVETFFESNALAGLYSELANTDIKKEIGSLKNTAALYSYYFAIDYLYRKENPKGEKLSSKYFKEFYGCDSNESREIYNVFRGSIKGIKKVKLFEDTLFRNPGGYRMKAEREGRDYFGAHIYLGNLGLYLGKSCKIKENKLFLRDLVPSATLVALRSVAFLPNGEYTNRVKNSISINAMATIDEWIQGRMILNNDVEIPLVKWEKINYPSRKTEKAANSASMKAVKAADSSPTKVLEVANLTHSRDDAEVVTSKVAELVNLVVLDDVFRVERLNTVLSGYIKYLEEFSEDKNIDEEALACVACLFMNMPKPILSMYEQNLYSIFWGIDERKSDVVLSQACKIFTCTSFTFPCLIGILCFILFYRFYEIKSDEQITKIIKDLEKYIFNNYDDLKDSLNVTGKKIWDTEQNTEKEYIKEATRNKGNGKTNRTFEWSKKHDKLLGEVLEIILDPTKNIFNTYTYIQTNYESEPKTLLQRYLTCKVFGIPGYLLTKHEKKKRYMPDEFVRKMAASLYHRVKLQDV